MGVGEHVAGEASSRPVRRRDAASTERRILTAAIDLFARHGFDAVSTKQLASAAGVAIGALYHHFPSKEAVYAAATRQLFESRSRMPDDLRDARQPAERRLVRLVAWYVATIVQDKEFGPLLIREMLDPRPGVPRLLDLEVFREPLALFRDLIATLAPKADPDEAMAAMVALILGYSSLKGIQALAPGLADVFQSADQIAEHTTRLLVRGLAG